MLRLGWTNREFSRHPRPKGPHPRAHGRPGPAEPSGGRGPTSHDFGQLEPMVIAAQAELGAAGVTDTPTVVLADAGYWHQDQMENIVSGGTQVLVPPAVRRLRSRACLPRRPVRPRASIASEGGPPLACGIARAASHPRSARRIRARIPELPPTSADSDQTAIASPRASIPTSGDSAMTGALATTRRELQRPSAVLSRGLYELRLAALRQPHHHRVTAPIDRHLLICRTARTRVLRCKPDTASGPRRRGDRGRAFPHSNRVSARVHSNPRRATSG